MRCGSPMIPWYFFTGFAKFQWIVSVNNFWFLRRLQKFSWTLLRLLWSLGFTRIRLYPLRGAICSTTACLWLFWDSPPSLRILWSAVIRSPNFTAFAMDPSLRLLQGTLVILVLKHTSQFLSLEKWVLIMCVRFVTTFAAPSESEFSFSGMCGHMRLQVL